MKKKFTSQAAFLNPRVLFGLCVMLSGVFMALLGFAQNQGRTTGDRTTRQEMALALAQALGPTISIPACVPGSELFSDVPASSPFCPYIEEMARRGVTVGCGGGKFCPHDPVLRQQMAAFIVKAMAPTAYAHVLQNGTVDLANSKNITQANVTLTAISAYCFKGLGFSFATVIANPDYGDPTSGGQTGLESTVALGDPWGDCSSVPGTQVEVATSIKHLFAKAGFFVIFH